MDDKLKSFVLNNIPFILYCDCNVEYDGRACSKLKDGKYLIIYKQDGSLQIHGANKITPRNYQGAKSILQYNNNILISINRKETITIRINDIINLDELKDWSLQEIEISKTEKELVNKLCRNINDFLGKQVDNIILEYKTDHGPVDIVAIDYLNIKYVIEVKRRKATIKDGTQLRKYLECIENSNGYVAAPDISDKALKYLEQHRCGFIKVSFDN